MAAWAPVRAADLHAPTFSALQAPQCIGDPSAAFVAQDSASATPQAAPPADRFYLVARHMGADAVAANPAFDFSRFPDDYGWPAVQGLPITGLAVPEPLPEWQRAARPDADVDTGSAFQLHCFDAGSYINTWTFPSRTIVNGGPHAIYGFSIAQPRAVFDGDPRTDFVVQANVEVPWFASWPDTSAEALFEPVGQVNLFAYFRDRTTGKAFALLQAIFDNRAGADGGYAPFVAHDGFTPFVSEPVGRDSKYSTLSPYSWTYTGLTWSGLRFFRAHVSPAQFRAAIADVNAHCEAHKASAQCAADPRLGSAFDPEPTAYVLTDFGLLHEVFRGGPQGNLSMGVHVNRLGAFNAR
jgi:hypothetical protein